MGFLSLKAIITKNFFYQKSILKKKSWPNLSLNYNPLFNKVSTKKYQMCTFNMGDFSSHIRVL